MRSRRGLANGRRRPNTAGMRLISLGVGLAVGLLGGVLAVRSARAARAAEAEAARAAPPPEVPADEGPVEVPAPSEKALRYYRGNNLIWGVEQVLGFAVPAVLLWTGLSARLRTTA